MTYDYFNTSYLAFGDKLKKAFKSLGSLLDNGYKKVDSLSMQLSFIGNYLDKNYQVINPNNEDDPCNCDTIYKLLRNNPISTVFISLPVSQVVCASIVGPKSSSRMETRRRCIATIMSIRTSWMHRCVLAVGA